MSFKSTPPEWLAALLALFWTAIIGALGAFVRQIHGPEKTKKQILCELLAGAICSVVGAEIIAESIYYALLKFDLINPQFLLPEKIIALSGFLCGALGVVLIDFAVLVIKAQSKKYH